MHKPKSDLHKHSHAMRPLCFLWYVTSQGLTSPNKYMLDYIKRSTSEKSKSSFWIFTVLRNILSGILLLQIYAWFQPFLHSTFCSNCPFTGRPFLTIFSKITLPTPSFYVTFLYFIFLHSYYWVLKYYMCTYLFITVSPH